jgi:hypothetical protein
MLMQNMQKDTICAGGTQPGNACPDVNPASGNKDASVGTKGILS